MSRFRRAIHGVASSYMLLVATAIYSLASVPVALHYLDKERFGLWALMGSLVNYLGLIDAGMSSSAGRLIIDYKDDRDGGQYGSLIKTGGLVFLVQGVIIFLAGLIFANSFAHLLAIPAGLQPEFIRLVNLQCGVLALSFATRIFNLMLVAHQRMDLVNYTGTLGLVVNFVTQWVFFHFGFGVLSLAWAGLFAAGTIVVCQWLACETSRLFPARNSWGRVSWLHFKELFAFAKDVFLVVVGTQLIMASQGIIITRLLGLPAAATWSIGTRVFNLLSQIIWRVSDMSAAAFAELIVRRETGRVRERYRAMVILTASLSGLAAVSLALCNSLFIPLWTHGKIQWPVMNDVLLGIWMIVLAILHCHTALVLLTKKVGFMRYVFFVEGVTFVTLSLLVARWGGLPAIITCSIVCSTCFSSAYAVWRITRYFNFPLREVIWDWFRPMGRMLLFYLPLAALAWWALMPLPSPMRLGFNAILAGSLGVYLFLRFGVPRSIQTEIIQHAPIRAQSLLKRIWREVA